MLAAICQGWQLITLDVTCFVEGVIIVIGKKNLKASILATYWKFFHLISSANPVIYSL